MPCDDNFDICITANIRKGIGLMTASGAKLLPAIGFLTVREFSELGLIGGYLILNTSGRPLEFHCTAPVRANRAQEILYGPTLTPYLYGEQIGQTLLAKAKSKPLFVCTNVKAALVVRSFVSTPVVWLDDAQDETVLQSLRLETFEHASYKAATLASCSQDRDAIIKQWKSHAEELDLLEPFSRLQEAIDEAQRGAVRSAA